MFGDQTWSPALTTDYLQNMHNAQPYMPPFPGARDELLDLAVYLQQLQHNRTAVPGAQQSGVALATTASRQMALRPPEAAR
jgi:hypothetical protein